MESRHFSKIGLSLYRSTIKGANYLIKHKWLYYILIYTWGLPYSIIGLLSSLVLLLIGKKPQKYKMTYFFHVSKGWGGASLGSNFLIGSDCNSCSSHECGHTFQVALFGPFFYFLVAIPSFIRYWYFTIKENQYRKQGKRYYYDYDAVWFEASATDAGKLVNQ